MIKLMISFLGQKNIKVKDVECGHKVIIEGGVPFVGKKIMCVASNDKTAIEKIVQKYLSELARYNDFQLIKYDVTEIPLFIKNPQTDVDKYLNEIWEEEKYRGNFELIIDAIYKKYEKEVKLCDITPSGVTFEEFAIRIVNELCDNTDREIIYKFVVNE